MEIAIENDLKFSARRQKRTMALRSRLITELNYLFAIMNDMSSDDNLSNEDSIIQYRSRWHNLTL